MAPGESAGGEAGEPGAGEEGFQRHGDTTIDNFMMLVLLFVVVRRK